MRSLQNIAHKFSYGLYKQSPHLPLFSSSTSECNAHVLMNARPETRHTKYYQSWMLGQDYYSTTDTVRGHIIVWSKVYQKPLFTTHVSKCEKSLTINQLTKVILQKLQCTGTHHKIMTRIFSYKGLYAQPVSTEQFSPCKGLFFVKVTDTFEYLMVWLCLEVLLCPLKS